MLGFPYLIESIFTLACRGFVVRVIFWLSCCFARFAIRRNVGFPYLIEGIAYSHVGVSPCLDNMIVLRLPNVS